MTRVRDLKAHRFNCAVVLIMAAALVSCGGSEPPPQPEVVPGMFDQAKLVAVWICHNRPLNAVFIDMPELAASQLLHAADCLIKVGHIQIYVDTVFHFVRFWNFLEQQSGMHSLLTKSQVFLILEKNVGS